MADRTRFSNSRWHSHTRLPFKHWLKLCHDFYDNSYGVDIVAVYKKQYIASTDITVYPKAEPHKGWTGGLGVLKEFRRKGIATALKIKAIEILQNAMFIVHAVREQ